MKKKEDKAKVSVPVVETAWGSVALWYDDLVETPGSYQRDLILPNLLRLLEAKKGEKILDLACGQGFFAREIAKAGAEVAGIDASAELIEIAKQKSPATISFFVSPAENMPDLKSGSFDKIVCVLAVQNMQNVQQVFAECARVLKQGGKFLFIANHPAFRNPKKSSWGFDEAIGVQYRRVDEYLSESKAEIEMNPGLNASGGRVGRTNSSDEFVLGSGETRTISFHRPLQFYFKALAKNNFCVRRLEEWNSGKESQAGTRKIAEDRARKEIPLFMAIEAIKNRD